MDLIKLLPDSVANQIAAGEVIQRPASVVKELLENAVDAGAKKIQLQIKEAGKKLIRVIDDGKGMTEADARMSFERHATSKISEAKDLFGLRTKGFRGEALASIAAIAHVDLKTRTEERSIGTQVITEGSKVLAQDAVTHPIGSSFTVKNLFYNVPARRKFLKSDSTEFRHIIEEFQRVALAHPEIRFSLHKDENQEIFNLRASNLRQRIVAVFGTNHDQRLVPVEEVTDLLQVNGFVGKPEFAKKSRGEQYLFLNNRFIKNGYLHYAIVQAYEGLLPAKSHPSYFLDLFVDPTRIDINIHPTKTEVKFDEERSIYAIISSAVRRSLGKYNIAPSLDFETEGSIQIPILSKDQAIRIPEISVDKDFNPFQGEPRPASSVTFEKRERVGNDWKQLYEVGKQLQQEDISQTPVLERDEPLEIPLQADERKLIYMLKGRYILSSLKSGLMLVDPKRAHERMLYEDMIRSLAMNQGSSQQLLFPETVDLSAVDMELVRQYFEQLQNIGFDIEEFGKSTIKVNGIPVGVGQIDSKTFFQEWLEAFKMEGSSSKNKNDAIARTMAKKLSRKNNTDMSHEEMRDLIDRLFATEQPYMTPEGKPIIVKLDLEELDRKFARRV